MIIPNPGGYAMLDAGGLDVTAGSSVTKSGIYNEIRNAVATGKVVVVGGLKYGSADITPAPASVKVVDTSYSLVVGDYIMTVTNADGVTFSGLTGMTPATPTSLTGEATADGVVLNWAPTPGARNYRIARKPSTAGSYTLLSNNVLTNTFTDTSTLTAGSYTYLVTAQNAYGTSSGVSVNVTIS